MVPAQVYRLCRNRFRIEYNFLDAKQHLGLVTARPAPQARHDFHVNAVLAVLTWARLKLRHAADQALDRYSMTNVKLESFLQLVLARLFETDRLRHSLQKYPSVLHARTGPH